MNELALSAAVFRLAASPALADRPPAGALPLSEISHMIETAQVVDYSEALDRDDDGYRDIA